MAPVRPDHYDFAFRRESLEGLRKQIKLTQAALADLLDVPVNTVSRWETGATTPDANALAAIYSIARSRGVTPQFFRRRASVKETQKQRTRLLVTWDFQNRGLDVSDVEEEWLYMRTYLDLCFPGTRANRQLWAYTSPHQREAAGELERLKFNVFEGAFDADGQVVQDVMEACQKEPTKTVFILAADDGNYSDLLRSLRQAGVDTYVWGTDNCSDRFLRAIVNGNFIQWDAPFVIAECVVVIKQLKGKPITRAQFGALCKLRLDESEIYPYDAGFSSRNPYGSVLRWLERQGIVRVDETDGKSPAMTIALQ